MGGYTRSITNGLTPHLPPQLHNPSPPKKLRAEGEPTTLDGRIDLHAHLRNLQQQGGGMQLSPTEATPSVHSYSTYAVPPKPQLRQLIPRAVAPNSTTFSHEPPSPHPFRRQAGVTLPTSTPPPNEQPSPDTFHHNNTPQRVFAPLSTPPSTHDSQENHAPVASTGHELQYLNPYPSISTPSSLSPLSIPHSRKTHTPVASTPPGPQYPSTDSLAPYAYHNRGSQEGTPNPTLSVRNTELTKRAEEHVKAGRLREAVRLYKDILTTNQHRLFITYRLVELLIKIDEKRSALRYIDKELKNHLVEDSKKHSELLLNLLSKKAILEYELKRFEPCIASVAQYLHYHSEGVLKTNAETLQILAGYKARSHFSLNETEEGLKFLKEFLDINGLLDKQGNGSIGKQPARKVDNLILLASKLHRLQFSEECEQIIDLIQEMIRNDDHLDQEEKLTLIVQIWADLGEYTKAFPLAAQAIQIYKEKIKKRDQLQPSEIIFSQKQLALLEPIYKIGQALNEEGEGKE